MNTVTVRINGVEYNLKGEEPKEYLQKVVGYVDKKMQEISVNNTMLSSSSACVLVAINAADEMFKAISLNEEFKTKIKALEEKNNNLDKLNQMLKKEIEDVKKSNVEHEKSEQEDSLKLQKEMEILQETAGKYIAECTKLKAENKEMKFQVQSAKYKMIDLQQKLIDNQIDLAVEKKHKKPLINK
jgi:cell division protein ZapA